jgi:exodeoxyribonuclease III
MKLISWNVNGLRAAWKKGFLDFLAAERAAALCVQETKIQADQLTEEMRQPHGYHSYWNVAEKRGYSGVVTYTELEPVEVGTEFGASILHGEGRIVHTELPLCHLLNVYFPNGGMGPERLAYKLKFYDAFLGFCENLRRRGKGVVVCGDVNTAHTEIDLARPKENAKTSGFMPVEREWVSKFIAHGYHDTFRLFTQDPGHYTWWDQKTGARARNIGWRIDYFFVSTELRDHVKAASILPHVQGSDHCPITLILE